jgi:hypothetical protein
VKQEDEIEEDENIPTIDKGKYVGELQTVDN